MKRIRSILFFYGLISGMILGLRVASFADSNPLACVQEIQTVCAHLEDHLETCLTDRGSQLSAPCRDQLKTAMDLMRDPTGPAACVADIQRLCPSLDAPSVSSCISDKQSSFSANCRSYLQSAGSKSDPSN